MQLMVELPGSKNYYFFGKLDNVIVISLISRKAIAAVDVNRLKNYLSDEDFLSRLNIKYNR